jgi:hypothetical protein
MVVLRKVVQTHRCGALAHVSHLRFDANRWHVGTLHDRYGAGLVVP